MKAFLLATATATSLLAADPAPPSPADAPRIARDAFQTLSSQLMAALGRGGPTNAIPFCSTRALDLTASVGRTNGVVLRRVTHAPRNPANAATDEERTLIPTFQTRLDETRREGQPPAAPEPVLRTNATGVVTWYSPIVLSNPLCLQCHGDPSREIAPATHESIRRLYPRDQATGFKLGDVRGLWRIDFPPHPTGR